MRVIQLRKLLEAFTSFAKAEDEDRRTGELQTFTAILPETGDESTADFVKRIERNLVAEGRTQKNPKSLRSQIERLADALEIAQAKTSYKEVKLCLKLFGGEAVNDASDFIQDLARARDYVVPAKPAKTGKSLTEPRRAAAPDQVVTQWIENLNSSLFSPARFRVALDTLSNDKKISDTRVKKIAKLLSGKPAKNREAALESLLQHQNKQVLSRESSNSLEQLRP
jgi:hypothetical protein